MKDVIEKPRFALEPQTFEQAWQFAEIIAGSDLVPKDFKNKPGNVLVAMQMGAELGLPTMQAIQNIAVINGRPCVWGDALLAMVKGSSLCEYFVEEWDDATQTATARTLRKGDPQETVRTFSMEDAAAAGLAGKQGPWKQYKKRMCAMRARGFCARDAYPDVLKGIQSAEEQNDAPRTIGSGTTAKPQPQPQPVDKRVEVEPPTEDQVIKFHGSILDMASNIGDLKNAFTDAYRAAKSIKSEKAQKNLKSLYDIKKAELETPAVEPEPEPEVVVEQTDADWLADLKEADNA